MSKSSSSRQSRHHASSQSSSLASSPYMILFILLLSTIGLIVMFHLLPNEHLIQNAVEHNMIRNIKSLNDAQLSSDKSPFEHHPEVISQGVPEESNYLHKYRPLIHELESHHHLADRRNSEGVLNEKNELGSGPANEGHSPVTGNVEKEPLPHLLEETLAEVNNLGEDTVLLIICSNRPDYLKKTLSFILQYHPKKSVPVIISQDGDNIEVNQVIEQAEKQFKLQSQVSFQHIHHKADRSIRYENGYFKLADHFKFALNYVFSDRPSSSKKPQTQRVIILEEDLQIAPDFFEYFAATMPLLENDPSLLAVSAWNDNGFKALVQDNQAIYRSDFFPGLGWMMTKRLWEELSAKWPRAYWDDWLREPKQRQNRQILRPEVCRTLHFGIHGVSNAQYSEYLESIRLNEDYVKFTELDLGFLSSESRWDEYYLDHQVRTSKLLNLGQLRILLETTTGSGKGTPSDHVRVTYSTYEEESRASDSYTSLCHYLGCMNNVKAGVPRTAYKGVTTVRKAGYTIHLVPKNFK